jgi:nitroimidazol reductase NimA-like FMN-containing flavoprotein (pyridoxamine 5'-phosphate oxidase superfamily)
MLGRENEKMPMRRTDHEIKSEQDIFDVLNRCDVIRLGINTPNHPYVVPMNFGVETDGQVLTLWLHCASAGLKLDLIRQDPRVGFEADCSHNLITGEKACQYTMEYESVIGCGTVQICADDDSKKRGLKVIMRHYAPDKDFNFSEPELAAVCVLRLDVTQITGKRLSRRQAI